MNIKIAIRLLVVVVLLITWSCDEENFVEPIRYSSVRGQVRFSSTRKPAKDVQVRLSPSSRTVETDSSGSFRFDSVAAGKYTLQTSLPGYLNEFAAIEVTDQQLTTVTLLLRDDKSQNRPPTAPVARKPKPGTDSVAISPTLSWTATDPERDSLTYDIALYQGNSLIPLLAVTGQKADSLLVKNLAYNTVYTWQVIVKDGIHAVRSDIFSFRTRPFPEFAFVFVKRVNGQLQLFTADSSTTSAVQLTSQGSNWRPIVSPNGQNIAFISNSNTDLHLNIMNRDGSNRRQVTTLPLAGIVPGDLSFCWSPNGTQLLYPVNDKLYLVRTDGTGLTLLTKLAAGQFFSGCDWTSQGDQIVARTTGSDPYVNQLLLINPQTGVPKLLYAPTGRISNPVFSLDGRQVLFSQDMGQFTNEQGRQTNARIQLLTLRDNTITDLAGNSKPAGTNDLDPRFSPNGARIIFTNADNTGTGVPSVVTTNTSGQDRKVVLRAAEMPYWR